MVARSTGGLRPRQGRKSQHFHPLSPSQSMRMAHVAARPAGYRWAVMMAHPQRGVGDCTAPAVACRGTLADAMAEANGSTCDNGSHCGMPSRQQMVLASSRPARQDWISCSAVKGPAGCLPSPGMYQEEIDAHKRPLSAQFSLSLGQLLGHKAA